MRRDVVFRMAYWERVEDLVGLLDQVGQQRALEAAKSAKLGRKTLQRFKKAMGSPSANIMSLESADTIAKRYALWTVRAKFDWCDQPPEWNETTQRIHENLTLGIYELDVDIRRAIETELHGGAQTPNKHPQLRRRVEQCTEEMEAAITAANSNTQRHTAWDEIIEYFQPVRHEVDQMLKKLK